MRGHRLRRLRRIGASSARPGACRASRTIAGGLAESSAPRRAAGLAGPASRQSAHAPHSHDFAAPGIPAGVNG
jgi:hypothetical protein